MLSYAFLTFEAAVAGSKHVGQAKYAPPPPSKGIAVRFSQTIPLTVGSVKCIEVSSAILENAELTFRFLSVFLSLSL